MRWSVLLWIPTVWSLVIGFNKKKRVRRVASSPPKREEPKPPEKKATPPPPEKKNAPEKPQVVREVVSGAKNEAATTLKPLVLAPRVMNLNVMVAGLSGLGKTTAVNALFQAWTGTKPKQSQSWFLSEIPTSSVDTSRVFEKYDKKNNVLFRVTIVDTPGFGNNIDHGDAVSPIAKYVSDCRQRQFVKGQETDEEGTEELVHACVYFMSPHRFLEIDRFFLKNVQNELPVIPVIAKSDTLTNEELKSYRKHLRSQFKKEGIQTYSFGNASCPQGSPRSRQADDCLAIITRDGSYPWGVSRVYDLEHSDFDTLRDSLLSEHTEKLIHIAKAKYCAFRSQKIQNLRRLAIIKTVAIVGFCTHSLATRTTLFPFLEDFGKWFWKYFSAGPNSPRRRPKKITNAKYYGSSNRNSDNETPRYLVGPFLSSPN